MGVRRRESAGSCLGHLARLPDRAQATRQRAIRFSGAHLSQAAAEFHLVGQSQGRGRQQHFPGRLSGLDNIGVFDRNDRCPPAASSSSPTARLDGHVLLNMLASRSSWPRDDRPMRTLPANSGSTSSISQMRMNNVGDRRRSVLWDEEDEFFYDVLRLPNGRACGLTGPLDGWPDPAVGRRDDRAGVVRAIPGIQAALGMVPEQTAGTASTVVSLRAGLWGAAPLSVVRGPPHEAAARSACSTRGISSPYGIRSLSQAISNHPYSSTVGGERTLGYEPGEVDLRPVRWQFQLARPDLDAGQLPADRGVANASTTTLARAIRSSAPPVLDR